MVVPNLPEYMDSEKELCEQPLALRVQRLEEIVDNLVYLITTIQYDIEDVIANLQALA